MKVTLVAGARPNFMKIAPIIEAIKRAMAQGHTISYRLVHTGQHYDRNMSAQFFEQLGIPDPDVNLEAGGGTQAEQTAAIMIGFERDLMKNPSDLVIVVGDVTSTLACSIVAKKLNTKVAHVEAGIRSGDWSMPEEVNRIVTDSITDYFFTTSETANVNLKNQGVSEKKIFFVGNTMIDTLLKNLPYSFPPSILKSKGIESNSYFVITLHRPNNVDSPSDFLALLDGIISNSRGLPLIFPVHPRTAKSIEFLKPNEPNLHLIEPLGYWEFIYLIKNAMAVITDSGGITEETTVLGIPCMTLRENTERPETITLGTNELLGISPAAIGPALNRLFNNGWKKGSIPPLWDGQAAERIVQTILKLWSDHS